MCPICHAHSGLIAHCNGFKKLDQEVPQDLLDHLNAANQHKATVFNQKMAFDLEKESLDTSKCIIIVDFKENLRIGCGPVKFKKDFYNYNQLSVLGFSE